MSTDLPLVFTRTVATGRGFTEGQIRRRVAKGTWTRLRRGVYAETHRLTAALPQPGARTPAETHELIHLATLAAAVTAAGEPVWLAGAAARWLLKLPEAHRAGQHLVLARDTSAGHHVRHRGVSISPAGVPEHHQSIASGLPVLAPARVVVDALRTEGLAESLMIGDRALRMGAATRGEIQRVLVDCRGWPGITWARERAALLDPRRETPLESASVALFVERDLPMPHSQYEVWHGGHLVGRADFAWVAERVLGEADGKTKYVDDLPGAGPAAERIWRERLRQDGFLEARWEVARWTDFERRCRPDVVERRVRAAMDRADRLGLTGTTG